jgi:division protein 1
VRTGSTFETLKYDHAVTGLQFDSRKAVAATGENGIKASSFFFIHRWVFYDLMGGSHVYKIYNRTSIQHSTLSTNGHTKPVEHVRYMDRYLVSGGRDSMIKIWSL